MSERVTFTDFQQGLAQGKLFGVKCQGCGAVSLPAPAVCPACGGQAFARHEAAGRGVVRAHTVVRVAPLGFKPPYVVAMVELDEGPWVVGRLEADPDQAGPEVIGQRVTVASQAAPQGATEFEDMRVLSFTPAV